MDPRHAREARAGLGIGERMAFALPALVIAVLAMLPIGLAVEVLLGRSATFADVAWSASQWVSVGGSVIAALVLLSWAQPGRSWAARLMVAGGGVFAGLAAYALLFVLIAVTGGAYLEFVIPALTVVLAVLAAARSYRAVEAHKGMLVIAWALALAAPFALDPLVVWLSEEAGSGGMDAIALFVLPLLGVFVWWGAAFIAAVLQRRAAG